MPEPASAPHSLAIDRVERARGKKDQVQLRVTGHWLGGGHDPEQEPLLVVQVHGRRHRFPAGGATHAEPDAGTLFSASFTIPDWAVPEQPGQAVLWVGNVVVPVPPPGTSMPAAEGSPPAPAPGQNAPSPAAPTPAVPTPAADPPIPEPSRAGPLADLLFKDTVSALHSELEQRAVELARLRGELARTRTDLERSSGSRSGVDAAHGQLREELERLTAAVGEQREQFERRTAALREERDRALRDAEAAGAERDRAVDELARVRTTGDERLERERTDADARLTEARARFDDHLATARSEFDQQLGTVRAEAEQEMSRARAETEAMLGAARSQAESRAQSAEAEVAALNQRLAAMAATEHRRAEEAAALREQLASAHIARDAAFTEAEGLRGELERLGSELAVAHERGAAAGGGLSDAEQLLADARALTERLRGESPL